MYELRLTTGRNHDYMAAFLNVNDIGAICSAVNSTGQSLGNVNNMHRHKLAPVTYKMHNEVLMCAQVLRGYCVRQKDVTSYFRLSRFMEQLSERWKPERDAHKTYRLHQVSIQRKDIPVVTEELISLSMHQKNRIGKYMYWDYLYPSNHLSMLLAKNVLISSGVYIVWSKKQADQISFN